MAEEITQRTRKFENRSPCGGRVGGTVELRTFSLEKQTQLLPWAEVTGISDATVMALHSVQRRAEGTVTSREFLVKERDRTEIVQTAGCRKGT